MLRTDRVRFVGTELHCAVASRDGKRGWQVAVEDGEVVERPLPTGDLAAPVELAAA